MAVEALFCLENEVDRKPAPYDSPSSEGEMGEERSIVTIELWERSSVCNAGRRSRAGGMAVKALYLSRRQQPLRSQDE